MVVFHTGDAGGGGARARAVQDVGLAADGRGRADAIPGDEHDPRRRVPGRLAQLLALELHERPSRRADRHRRRAVRDRPVADDRDPVRALPRRGDARRRDRHRGAAPRRGLEPRSSRASGSTRPTRRRTSTGRATPSPRCSRTSAAGAGSTTSATTRATTRSAPPTARTTTGSSRSSAATTRTTSSTSTTTSCREVALRATWRPASATR